jgi:hypothetical protein
MQLEVISTFPEVQRESSFTGKPKPNSMPLNAIALTTRVKTVHLWRYKAVSRPLIRAADPNSAIMMVPISTGLPQRLFIFTIPRMILPETYSTFIADEQNQ